jgi:hypothetical protein
VDSELELLLGSAIDSLLKLELLLYLHARPGIVEQPEAIAKQLRRLEPEVVPALEGLSEAGLIDRFAFGTGRHVVYGPAEDEHVHNLVALIDDCYHGEPGVRADLVRRIVGLDVAGGSPSP